MCRESTEEEERSRNDARLHCGHSSLTPHYLSRQLQTQSFAIDFAVKADVLRFFRFSGIAFIFF